MAFTPEEARNHFAAIERTIQSAGAEVREEGAVFQQDCPDIYCFCRFRADTRAVLTLLRTGVMSRRDAAALITHLKQTRLIHPDMRPAYNDHIAAQGLLASLDREADQAMSQAGLERGD